MAHHTTEADMPWIELPGEYSFVFEALSPTTGAAISGVAVSEIVVYSENLDTGGVFDHIIPKLTPDEIEGLN